MIKSIRVIEMFDFLKRKKQKNYAVIVAAGSSTRMGKNVNKIFIDIFAKPVLFYSLQAFQKASSIDEIIVVTKEEDIPRVAEIVKKYRIKKAANIVKGGATRRESVANGLALVEGEGFVAIHDGARPCITSAEIDLTVEMAKTHGAASLGCKTVDTLKTVDGDGFIQATIDRTTVWQVQTPQVFQNSIIKTAYELPDDGATDDCMIVEKTGNKIYMVPGTAANIKITTNNDLYLAMAIIQSRK